MHYHLDERMEPLPRLLEQMERHNIAKTVLIAPMVDPFHMEGFAEKASGVARKMLTARLNRPGLLIYESTVTKDGKFKLLNKCFNIDMNPDNEIVSRAMADYPERFYGWFFINPATENVVEKMEHGINAKGWLGVKCHPFWHCFPVHQLDDAAAYCVQKDMPMLIHLGGQKDNGDYRYLPRRYPKLKLIYAHAGVPHYKRLWQYVKELKNVYVDLSSPYLDEPLRRAAVRALGAEKCLYGTDGPYGYRDSDHMYDHGAIIAEIDRLPLSTRQKERILGENFAELAGLQG